MTGSLLTFDIPGIKRCQQNRYPLLFIDRVYDVIPRKQATAVKCFTYNEWFFPAHFDDDPNVPGFIQLEALVQTFLMTFLSDDTLSGKKTNFIKVSNMEFKRKIVPGETLIIRAELKSLRRGIASGNAQGLVDDEPTCRADLVVAIPDELDKYKPKSCK